MPGSPDSTSTDVNDDPSASDDSPTPDDLFARRELVLGDPDLDGVERSHRLAMATDDWLAQVAGAALERYPTVPPFALLAVGGYGRGELAPFSDIDLIIVYDGKPGSIDDFAAAIWYPIWDRGLQLGHALRTVRDQTKLLGDDLDTATAMLATRLVFGDADLADRITTAAHTAWSTGDGLAALRDRFRSRRRESGDVAYTLEPDLKTGHSGLRDAQSLWWAAAAGVAIRPDDLDRLQQSYDTLVNARVALHRASGRAGDVLRLDLQDAVAELVGTDADSLMRSISRAGRQIAWLCDLVWADPGGGPVDPVEVAPNVWLHKGIVQLADAVDVASDPTVMFRVATVAARHQARIGRATLDRMAAQIEQSDAVWRAGGVDKLVALLMEGHAAIRSLEALDQFGLIEKVLPEWEPNRARPQRNAYHRFTVDRHLWEAAANAADLADTVGRPDLLVLGGLFHDIGKGYPGDHSEVGAEMIDRIGPRIGLSERDTSVLRTLVRHHLLLPDIAQRRDVSDPATIEFVADVVGTGDVLELLHALTIADSKATGPAAWSPWKEELLADLVSRVAHVVGGGDVSEVVWTVFPDAATLEQMASGVSSITVYEPDRVVAVYVDLPGALYRIAGALSLHGLDVVSARAHSDHAQLGRVTMAAAEFRIDVADAEVPWDRVRPDLERALVAQLAIDARLAERAHTYRHTRRVVQAADPVEPTVNFDDRFSSDATVVEVRAATRIGILYAITRALASTGCDIRHATMQTIGLDVYDTFYVRDWNNQVITDPAHRAEIVKAVLFAVRQPTGS